MLYKHLLISCILLTVNIKLSPEPLAAQSILNLEIKDFHISGTQIGEINQNKFLPSRSCQQCHGGYDSKNEPFMSWQGGMMAHAGRDPLFRAQMTLANQEVKNAGYFCQRCHMPMSIASGSANVSDGSANNALDLDGINCHSCHSMIDPKFKADSSPFQDKAILSSLNFLPKYIGNAQYILDPEGIRRGPRKDSQAMHSFIFSSFFSSAEFCGQCHDVSNPAISKQADGSFIYNAANQPAESQDPRKQFPLQRTYSEWKLSSFAKSGVDMQGRFGGKRKSSIVSTCQDCHMPKANASASKFTSKRSDLSVHELAGGGAHSLDLIAALTAEDQDIDQEAISRGRAASVSMLKRAASLAISVSNSRLSVKITNQTGHKLPTGHAEGRRIWLNIRFYDQNNKLIAQRGAYNYQTSELDSSTTKVYQMFVGLDSHAAKATGLTIGKTHHMLLANKIIKDNRIPPRGFTNSAYNRVGAGHVAARYSDYLYWDKTRWIVPKNAKKIKVSLFYQGNTKEYIKTLRGQNKSDQNGELLYKLWLDSGRATPIEMARSTIKLR